MVRRVRQNKPKSIIKNLTNNKSKSKKKKLDKKELLKEVGEIVLMIVL